MHSHHSNSNSRLSPSAYNTILQLGGLTKVLSLFYPVHDWNNTNDPTNTQKRSSTSSLAFSAYKIAQRLLFQTVSELYEGKEVVEEYSHSAASWPGTVAFLAHDSDPLRK